MQLSRYRLIYLHTPKTGGNSIQSVLLPFSDDRIDFGGFRDGVERFELIGPVTPRKHATLADYAAAISLTDYKIAISVRHPFERAVSYYLSPTFWTREREGQWDITEPALDRDAFLLAAKQMLPMSSFIKIDNIVHWPDFIVRYERIQVDFSDLCKAVNIRPGELPRRNRSAAPHLKEILLGDEELRHLVCDFYAEDMELFGYAY